MTPPAPHAPVDLASRVILPEVLRLVPFETARRCQLIPFELKDEKLRVAAVRPGDLAAMDDVAVLSGHEMEVYAISPEALEEALRRHYAEDACCAAICELGPAGERIVEAVEALIAVAVERRASDIHLEPQKDRLFVRLRVDGILSTVHAFPKAFQPAVLSRIKIMAAMDIAERRLPQDGQISVCAGGKNADLRVSTLPGKYGEKIVVRILDKSGSVLGLDRLGLDPATQGIFEAMIDAPHGIILVTGPTGSGKTTTLYSILRRLRSPLKNIITLEDPIEYELLAGLGGDAEMGVTQVQIQPKIGLSFAAGLRAALRQDPDVIMVGEIRDKETAQIATKAAMTGHLVLSTLHTNDALSALSRLRDIGVEPYLTAATLIGVLAQRLVRMLCPHCKERYRPPLRALQNMFPGRRDLDRAEFCRPRGCSRCSGCGYRGRMGIFELLAMSEDLRAALRADGSRAVLPDGHRSMRQSGMELVFSGRTTVEEVLRAASD